MSEMAHIEQQVTINASAKKIFDTISNVDSAATLMPGIKITGHDGNTVLADFAVQLNGTSVTFHGVKIRIADTQEPTAVTIDWEGPFKSISHVSLRPSKDATLVAVDASYQLDTGGINNVLSAVGNSSDFVGTAVGGLTSTTTVDRILPAVVNAFASVSQQALVNLKSACEG
jgi:carbon monoxide dehydrogenase subunit G